MRRLPPLLFLPVFGVLLAAACAEIVLHVLGISYPLWAVADADLGWALRPRTAGWFRVEGFSYVSINGDGLRDRDHELQKPPGTYRIAVLGDSFAEAKQVDAEKTFWAVLGKELAVCPAIKGPVEVINFGVSGYGTTQELLMFRKKARRYRPDLVLLAFYPGNDIKNNSMALSNREGSAQPYFRLAALADSPGPLILDNGFRDSPSYRGRDAWWRSATRHSYVLQLLKEGLRNLLALANRSQEGGGCGIEEGLEVLRAPESFEWKEAWRITEEVMALLQREVQSAGAELWIGIVTMPFQVDPHRKCWAEIKETFHISDFTYPNRRIAEFAARLPAAVVDLAPVLAEEAETQRNCVHAAGCRGHWNEAGHKAAGRHLARRICGDLSRRSPSLAAGGAAG